MQNLIILLSSLIVWQTECTLRRIKRDTTKAFHRTGEPIALDNLIQKYEREHQKLYEKKFNDGHYLEWSALDNKNLSKYCRNYLHHSVPTRTTANVIGHKIRKTLYYREQNATTTSNIVALRCQIMYVNQKCIYYYMTRAPEPNCVYALKCTKKQKAFTLTIIHKYCDFEDNQSISNILKWKREECVDRIHHDTGQPIAKDNYLLEYELKHQELFQTKEEEKFIEWPYVMIHDNLNHYCYQYIGECAPTRKRNYVSASWKTEKLHYQKLDTNQVINVTTVTCVPYVGSSRHYHITRAPETNCVYALLRKHRGTHHTFVIIFKHCGFEEVNNKDIISQDVDIPDDTLPKTEIKEDEVSPFKTI